MTSEHKIRPTLHSMFNFLRRWKNDSAGAPGTLWLDLPDAGQRIRRMKRIPEHYRKGLLDLLETGFTVFPGAMDPALCDQAMADYRRYLKEHADNADRNVDELGRHNRLVNFHMSSAAELELGTAPFLMDFLDLVFGMTAAVYTSLTFEYGTEQPIHRDSPFFHTFPVNYFVGAWIALEDIDPEAGPLRYIPGGHRYPIDQHAIYRRVAAAHPGLEEPELVKLALEDYYAVIDEHARHQPAPVEVHMKKGGLAIWHPGVPHGGAPAIDRSKTRHSVVFHCAPEALQVYPQDVFFSHEGAQAPPPRYGFRRFGGRAYAATGEPAFM